jgi:hypothetical protein
LDWRRADAGGGVKHKRTIITTEVEADIDLSEIMESIPTKMLEDELAARDDRSGTDRNVAVELIEAIRENDRTHLRIVLDRWLPGAGAMI